MSNRVVAFEIVVNGVRTAVKSQDDLTNAIRQTSKVYKSADFGSEAAQKAAKELDKLKAIQANLRKERRDAINKERANVSQQQGYYRQLQNQLVKLKNDYKDLTKEELEAFGPNIQKQVKSLSDELKSLDSGLGDNFRKVGDYSGGIKDAFSQLGGIDLASLATIPGAVVAISTVAIEAGQYVFQITEEFRKLRGEIQNLTDATGPELDEFTARISAIGETFEQSQTDVVNAANSVSQQLEIPFTEALDRIEEGFIAGSNQTGEFLDSLKEYPAFFKEAGLGADALFQVLNKQATEGIFSDKGVDVVKEVTLRLRENATATAAALEGIGLESEKVQKQIEDEGIGAAIATVAERLSQLRADSPEVGAAIADIFGGPGEDAGLAFITSLQTINEETGSLIDQSNEYQLQQQRALQINREFAEVQNEVAKEIGGAGAEFENLGTIIETKALQVLLFVVERFKELLGIFSPLVNAFRPLLEQLGLFNKEGSFMATVAELIAKGFRIAIIPIELAVGVISKIVEGLTSAVKAGRNFLEWVGIIDEKGPDVSDKVSGMSGSMGRLGGSVKRTTEEQKKQEKEIEKTNKTLDNYKKKTDQAAVATDQFAKGSIAALKKEISDLQKELNEAAPENAPGVLEKLIGAEKALEQVEKAREELRNKLVAGNRQTQELSILPTLDSDQIQSQTDAYKESFETVSEELADKQIAEQQRASEEILKTQEETAKGIKAIQDAIFSGIGDVLDNISESSQIRYDNELSALEERYEAETAAAGNNAREKARLDEQYSRERSRLEQKAFEEQKKYRKAAALASLAEGIINILSAPTSILDPFGAIYKAVRIGILTTTTAQQIANIDAQQAGQGMIVEMAKGGILHGATHLDPSGGIPISVNGQRILAENGEFFEAFGNSAVVINKRSTAKFRNVLQQQQGRIYPGKREFLSAINSHKNYGVKFAQSGAILQPEVASVISGRTGNTPTGPVQLDSQTLKNLELVVERGAIKGTAYGSQIGVTAGMGDATKRAEREARLRKRTGV